MNEENFQNQFHGDVTVCPKCHTSVQEILETGFVGCEKCYELAQIRQAVDKMFGGKRHKN